MRRVLFFLLFLLPLGATDYVIHLNDKEKYAIKEIISSLGEKNIARLFMDSSRLTELGNSIDHVPPLQFLGYILSEPYLKKCLKLASTGYFQWRAFLDGFGPNMDKEYAEGRLLRELPGFARLVGGKAQELIMLSQEHNWEDFVLCLL